MWMVCGNTRCHTFAGSVHKTIFTPSLLTAQIHSACRTMWGDGMCVRNTIASASRNLRKPHLTITIAAGMVRAFHLILFLNFIFFYFFFSSIQRHLENVMPTKPYQMTPIYIIYLMGKNLGSHKFQKKAFFKCSNAFLFAVVFQDYGHVATIRTLQRVI